MSPSGQISHYVGLKQVSFDKHLSKVGVKNGGGIEPVFSMPPMYRFSCATNQI